MTFLSALNIYDIILFVFLGIGMFVIIVNLLRKWNWCVVCCPWCRTTPQRQVDSHLWALNPSHEHCVLPELGIESVASRFLLWEWFAALNRAILVPDITQARVDGALEVACEDWPLLTVLEKQDARDFLIKRTMTRAVDAALDRLKRAAHDPAVVVATEQATVNAYAFPPLLVGLGVIYPTTIGDFVGSLKFWMQIRNRRANALWMTLGDEQIVVSQQNLRDALCHACPLMNNVPIEIPANRGPANPGRKDLNLIFDTLYPKFAAPKPLSEIIGEICAHVKRTNPVETINPEFYTISSYLGISRASNSFAILASTLMGVLVGLNFGMTSPDYPYVLYLSFFFLLADRCVLVSRDRQQHRSWNSRASGLLLRSLTEKRQRCAWDMFLRVRLEHYRAVCGSYHLHPHRSCARFAPQHHVFGVVWSCLPVLGAYVFQDLCRLRQPPCLWQN